MLERSREAEILATYETELDLAVTRLTAAQREVDTLKGVVQSIRNRLASSGQAGRRPLPSVDDLPTYRGQPSMRAYLRRLMEIEVRMDADALVATVQADPHYADSVPSRNTILARANDLVRNKVFVRPTDAEYAIASPNGSARAPRGATKLGPGEPLFTAGRESRPEEAPRGEPDQLATRRRASEGELPRR